MSSTKRKCVKEKMGDEKPVDPIELLSQVRDHKRDETEEKRSSGKQ
jgi:hypothetical protein